MPPERVRQREDILRPLAAGEIDELLQLYASKYGKGNFHYCLLYNQCKWNRQLQQLGAHSDGKPDRWIAFRKQFFTHRNGDFRKSGTYVSLNWDIKQSVSFHSWEPQHTELWQCLSETALIDWRSGPLFTNVDLPFCEQVKAIGAQKGATVERARNCHSLVLDHSKALNLEIPKLEAGYKVRELQQDNAHLIHSVWPNKLENSLQYIEGLIQLNQTIGIFSESDNSLVAWIFQNDFSGIGILQVLPSVQRRGFGSFLASSLCKRIAETEQVQLSAWIVIENYKSESLLEKVGFEKSARVQWIQLNKAI